MPRRNRSAATVVTLVTLTAQAAAQPAAEPVFASAVVYHNNDGAPVTMPVSDGNLTFGPFSPSGLWNTPASVLGKPNTLDYDDLAGWGPVPGGFAGGPMRQIHMAWPAWQYGSADPAHLGQRPGWLDGRRLNGLGLTPGAQLVVTFDEPIANNPPSDQAPWGVDFIVHGNAWFVSSGPITAATPPRSITLTGTIAAEPIEVSVAESLEGPWYTFARPADDLFPTQPWLVTPQGDWSSQESDWTRPVDPALTAADFANLTAEAAAALYSGSAGGTPFDLDALTTTNGTPADLAAIRYVRFRDTSGNAGEITAVADVPAPPPACPADLAPPTGTLDIDDVLAFLTAFATDDPAADLAAPAGTLNIDDVLAFLTAFAGGCP